MSLKAVAKCIFKHDIIESYTGKYFNLSSGGRVDKKTYCKKWLDPTVLRGTFGKEHGAWLFENHEHIKVYIPRLEKYLCSLCNIRNKGITERNNPHLQTGHIFSFKNYTLYQSAMKESSGEMVLYSVDEKKITDLDPKIYIKSLPSEVRRDFTPNYCIMEYDPYVLDPIGVTTLYGQQIPKINLYVPPNWRLLKTPKTEPPKILKEFMQHLFPNVQARKYVYCWLKRMILTRNYTYLGLNGAKGIGKNIFAENLCGQLVGSNNFGKAKPSLLDSQFNAILKNKRCILLDEMKVDKRRHGALKDFINEKQNIELKGVDANNVTTTHNSFIILNNDTHDVYVEWDDRRFCWIPTTSEMLKSVFSKAKINKLLKCIENEEKIKSFGDYVLSIEDDIYDDHNFVWECEKFHSLVFSSLHSWQQFLVSYLIGPESLDKNPLSEIREIADAKCIKNFPTNNSKVSNFLLNYRHGPEKDIIGEVVTEKSVKMVLKTMENNKGQGIDSKGVQNQGPTTF